MDSMDNQVIMDDTTNKNEFTPTEDFWQYLRRVPSSVCMVHLTVGPSTILQESRETRGLNMMTVDVTTQSPVEFPWVSGFWPLIINPTGAWCHRTVERARRQGASVIYVGLRDQYRKKIGHNQIGYRVYGKMGEQGEALYFLKSLDFFKGGNRSA
jgi:hypothetical protein